MKKTDKKIKGEAVVTHPVTAPSPDVVNKDIPQNPSIGKKKLPSKKNVENSQKVSKIVKKVKKSVKKRNKSNTIKKKRPEKETVEQRIAKDKDRFLELMTVHRGRVSYVCDVMGIERSTAYRWREADRTFSDKWDKIVDESGEYLADLAENTLESAMKGGGKGAVTAAIFTLKNKRGEKWKEKSQVDGNIEHKHKIEASKEDLTKLAEAIIESSADQSYIEGDSQEEE